MTRRERGTTVSPEPVQLDAGERPVIGWWKERYALESQEQLTRDESNHWLWLRYLARTGRLNDE